MSCARAGHSRLIRERDERDLVVEQLRYFASSRPTSDEVRTYDDDDD